MTYEIQHDTWVDGWINTITAIDGEGNEAPLVFDTADEAQADLDEYMGEIAAQIKSGEREVDEGYDLDEFRIRKVN